MIDQDGFFKNRAKQFSKDFFTARKKSFPEGFLAG